jgi:hypothetical protein
MNQSSVSIQHFALFQARDVFTDIFNGLCGEHLSFSDLLRISHTTTVLEIGVAQTSDSPERLGRQCSDIQHRTSECFSCLQETARVRSRLDTKDQIILIVASGLAKIFPVFDQLEFYDLRS